MGASERLRPILMTACAMTVGMVPMALALERGSQMQAPLGRAVIGGLVMSTFATLLVVPSIFALVIGRSKARTRRRSTRTTPRARTTTRRSSPTQSKSGERKVPPVGPAGPTQPQLDGPCHDPDGERAIAPAAPKLPLPGGP